MNAFDPSSFRRWLAKRQSVSRSQVRRRKNAGMTASAQTHVVVQGVELLEDRVVLDATKTVFSTDYVFKVNKFKPTNGLQLVAIGSDATFKTETKPLRDSHWNLGAALKYVESYSEGGRTLLQGTVVSTTSPVEVWDFNKRVKLFTLPHGGMFRSFEWNWNIRGTYHPRGLTLEQGRQYAGKYTDIVPRFGLVSVDNGQASTSTTAQQQFLETSPASGSFGLQSDTFRISWKGQTTEAMTVGASPAAVESALNALSNIGKVGGKVSVVEGAAGKGSYVVTFGGSIYKAPALLSLEGSSRVNTKVSVVTSVALTKRDDAADNNGNGLVIPLSGYPGVAPSSFAWNNGIVSQLVKNYTFGSPDYWTIPADRVATFPIANAPNFTPVQFGVAENEGLEPRILGRIQFDSPYMNAAFSDSTEGKFQVSGDDGSAVVVRTDRGLELRYRSQRYLDVVPTSVDSLGRPRPITIQFGGLTFEVVGKLLSRLDFTTGKANFYRSVSGDGERFNGLRATFPGGSLLLDFSEKREFRDLGIELDTRTGALQMTDFILRELEIGGYKFLPPEPDRINDSTVNKNGTLMTYDATTQKFSFKLDTSNKVIRNGAEDQTLSNAVVISTADNTDFSKVGIKITAPADQVNSYRGYVSISTMTSANLYAENRDVFGEGESIGKMTAEFLQSRLRSGVDAALNEVREKMKDSFYRFFYPETRSAYGDDPSKLSITVTVTKPDDKKAEWIVRAVTNTGTVLGVTAGTSQAPGSWPAEIIGITTEDTTKIAITGGSLSITKGVLDPIDSLPVRSVEIIRRTPAQINGLVGYRNSSSGLLKASGNGMFAAFTPVARNNSNGTNPIAANSLLIYGQAKTPLQANGLTVPGIADLGTRTSGQFVITNSFFQRMKFGIADLKVGGLSFTPAAVGSNEPLYGTFLPAVGSEPAVWSIVGGATLQPGGTVFKTGLKASFGGGGSNGVQVYPGQDKFTLDFSVADSFTAGTNVISSAPGLDGLKVIWNDSIKKFVLAGRALLDFKSAPGVAAVQKLQVTATTPSGSTGLPVNALDGSQLNFYMDEKSSLNGFVLSPLATTNPLRVSLKADSDTFAGDFSMLVGGRSLFGSINPVGIARGTLPATGLTADFSKVSGASQDWSLTGVLLTGLKNAVFTENNTKLVLPFARSIFEGQTLAQGAVGAEPNVVTLLSGDAVSASIKGAIATKIGDVNFSSFTADLDLKTALRSWKFKGAGKYFGRDVNVGKDLNSPTIQIGGNPVDPTLGYQLLQSKLPTDGGLPQFPLPKIFTLKGVNFDLTKFVTEKFEEVAGKSKTYTISTKEYNVNIGQTSLTFSGSMQLKVSLAGPEIVSFSATVKQNTKIWIGNASIRVDNLALLYDVADKRFEISGAADFFYVSAKTDAQFRVSLGTQEEPGLVIKDGVVESFIMSVTGEINLFKLKIMPQGVTVAYNRENQEYAIFGNVLLNTNQQGKTQVIKDMKVSLGASKDKPGIRIVSGSVEDVDISLTGDINLFGITASPEKLRVRYSSAENQVRITGGIKVTLAKGLVLKASLPGKGLLIDTETGEVQVRGVRLRSQGDINFGALKIKNLEAFYEDNGAGTVTIGASAIVAMPSGLEVGGSFKIVNGQLDAISIHFQKNPGILVANGIINIYSIDGSVEGLSDLENFKLSATVKATVGPKVSFAGKSHSVADVTGTITVTKDDLTLEGDVKLVGGLFGNGTFKGVLTWSGTANVKFDAEVRLYPGDIIRGKISAYVDVKGNVDFDAGIGVYVPNQIPAVGGISLGQLTISLRVRPEEPAANSYVRFGFQVLNANGSIKASFDANVHYDFSLEFFFFSINVDGNFQLRDADSRPTVRIVSARQTAGTPDGRIVFTGTSDLPAESIVDLYADTDAAGNDGILIGSSIPLGTGNQTFVWKDLSTFAKPGQPIYVYAVLRDDEDQQAYSDYSLPFTVASGFLPSISAPTSTSFTAGGVTTFTPASGGPIKIDDPRKKIYADSKILVTLESGAGILDLPALPTGVTTAGAGTHKLTLEGRQDDVNKALAGLRYVSSFDAMFDDTVKVSVVSLPLENLDAVVTSTIDMRLSPVTISTIATQTFDGVPSTTVFTGDADNTPLEGIDIDSRYSDSLTGIRIQINNYVPDSDSLQFSLDDEISSGIDASFDAETGVLILTGFETIEDYESALRQVVFQTEEVRADKSLTISVLDDEGGRAEFQVPLVIRKSHEAPEIVFDGSGLIYTQGDGSVAVASASDLIVHDEKNVVRVDLSFARSSYRAGEDVLSYVNTGGPIVGSFNSATGVLSLTGNGTRSQFAAALRAVQYQSTGAVFTPGARYVAITVTDSGRGHSTGSALQVILKRTVVADINAPLVTLSKEVVEISPSDDLVFLDDELTLASDLPRLVEARVSLSDGYRSGEQSLEVGELWGNLRARFDENSGELIISGVATVEEYEAVLRSVLFIDTAADRVGSTLTVSYFVTDGVSEPTSTAMQISIVDAPHLDTRLENVLVYEDGREAVVIDNGLSISFEGQLTGATVQFTGGLEAAEDRLLFDDQNGITGQYNHRTGILKLTGTATVQQYETALESVRYYNARYNPSAGERILEIQVQNGTTFSNSVEALISVEPNVKGPRISLGSGGPVFQEDGAAVRIAPNFDLSAFDATETSTSAALVLHGVEIAVMNYVEGEDLLSFTDTAKINGEWNAEEGILFLYGSATFAEYEAAVRQVRYSNSSDVPSTAPRRIRISLLDSAENGLGRGTLVTKVVRATADRPVKVAGNTNAVYVQQNGEPVSLQLGDLRYRAPSSFTESDVEMVVRITEVPAETMGEIVNANGDALAVGDELPIDDLASLTFEPALGAVGGCDFGFTVHLSDPESDRLDDASVAESVHIVVNGLATRTASEAFVAQIFRDLTGRDASAKTVKAWSTILNGQLRAAESPQDVDVARAIVVEQIMQSVTARNGQVTQIYQSLLGRLPSATERSEAMELLKSGSTLDSLRLTLATSDEYYEASGATSSQYVTALFEDLRGEDGTSEETSRWTAALERGDSRLSVATTILDAGNATERFAPRMFEELLGRPIDDHDNEDFDFYNVSIESLLQRILSSDEYFGRHAVPTSARLAKPRPTSGYSAVGRLGDAAGDKATGTLIAPQFVLVAAHSVADIPPGQLTFTLGNVVHRVTRAWVHPNYDSSNTGTDSANDIAILKLVSPVTDVTPAALSTIGVTEGDLLNLVGFGEQNGDEYGTKRRGTTPVVDDVNLNTFQWTVHSAWENDSDPGDSGAPLFLKHDGVEYVAGIVSGGINLPGRFGDTSLNTRVDSYLTWINEITGLNYGSSVSIKVADASITEGTGGTTPLTFTVTRTGRTDLAASVRYTVETDKTDAADFTGNTASRILRFAAGETEKTVTIQIKGDAKWEPLETFRITLSSAVGMSIADASAEVSIRNDDFFNLVYSSESQKIVTTVNDAGILEIRIGSVLQPRVSPERIGSITINGGDADDSINLTGLSAQKYTRLRSINLNGGEGDDTIVGAKFFDESISGGPGNDTLHGGTGGFDRLIETAPKGSTNPVQLTLTDARLIGTSGRDVIADFESAVLIGGAGADTLDGSAFTGRLTLFGLGGNDTLKGGRGNDLLRGGAGNDVMSGGGADDVITGEAGDDRLIGDTGRDILVGGTGRDVLRGGSGEDLLLGDSLAEDSSSSTVLRGLQAEWSSINDRTQRISNMSLGGGLNGDNTFALDAIMKDSTPDSLAGGTDANWFIAEDVDTLFDLDLALGDVLDVI